MEPFFRQVEKKTGVQFEEILALANAIQHADFSNEKQVRKIVRKVGKMANRPVDAALEDKIVKSIMQDGQSLDINQIEKMMR